MDHILGKLGLTRLEIKVYKMILDRGSSSVSDIAQTTGIHRRNVYDSLERLIQKGLVGYIKKNNRKVFSVSNPKRILDKLQEQEAEWQAMMPTLMDKFQAVSEKKETLFYRGKAGLKLIFEDQIQEGKEVLVNATSTNVQKVLKYFFPKYQLLRKEHKIATRMLFDSAFKTKKINTSVQKLPFCKVKYVQEFNKSPMSQYIYGDTVAIVVWSEDPIAILIKQKEIADGFRANFEVLWKIAK